MPYIVWLYGNDREAIMTPWKHFADRLVSNLPRATSTFIPNPSPSWTIICWGGGRVAKWEKYSNLLNEVKNDDSLKHWLVSVTQNGIENSRLGDDWNIGDMTDETRKKLEKEHDYRVVAWFIQNPRSNGLPGYDGDSEDEDGKKDDKGRTWRRVPNLVKQSAKSWFK
jgi:hypothetical protein